MIDVLTFVGIIVCGAGWSVMALVLSEDHRRKKKQLSYRLPTGRKVELDKRQTQLVFALWPIVAFFQLLLLVVVLIAGQFTKPKDS